MRLCRASAGLPSACEVQAAPEIAPVRHHEEEEARVTPRRGTGSREAGRGKEPVETDWLLHLIRSFRFHL